MIYEKLPVVLLSTMAAEKNQTTNSLIASYILSHREEAKNMGIKELAERCHVGTGSISRFCREVGFRDFSELKQLIEGTSYYFEKIEAGDASEGAGQWLDHVFGEMRKALDSLDLKQAEKLCGDIRSYDKIFACGMMKAESAAISLQADMLMLGKQVHTSVAYADQIEKILAAGKDELIIIFSYTGSYFDCQDFRAEEKHLILPKIWMICGSDRKLPWFVDEVLRFESGGDQLSHPYQLQMAESIIAQMYASQKAD